jgi:hypothetical protein
LAPVGRARWWGKGVGGWIQCKNHAHLRVNAIMVPVVAIPWMGRGDKGSSGGDEFKYDIVDTL